ncbi:MAG TPA: IS4 family transposase [Terriglobia bacterium]|nr:IS4 family transposase [Terriglobia bacterium]
MNLGQNVFSQIMEFASRYEFGLCVERYHGDYKVQSFSCWDQFLTLAFAQLTYRESLRDIEVCLRAKATKLYHMGIRGRISRNTLAHANQVRDWRIYADFAQVLIATARDLYLDDPFGIELRQAVYALDSTTIDLCLSLFPWAQFRRHKSAIKLHTLLDLRGNIPTVVIVTGGKVHDAQILDQMIWEPGAIYLLDRGYLHFRRLYRIHQCGAFFITRSRQRLDFQRYLSQSVDKSTGLRCDQLISLNNPIPKCGYPERFRRIGYVDPDAQRRLVFLTNNTILPALTVADLYRYRWQVELFFRWIKQHLRIKAFYGTSDNAVKTQVWTAISVYVLIAIIKKRLNLDRSLFSILQILSVSLFEKTPLVQLLTTSTCTEIDSHSANQLILFD